MGKKNEFIFNIGFNQDNPEHVKVARILNRLGHGKASYITKAVVYYEEHGKTVSGGALPIDYNSLEQMVRRILDEQREKDRGGRATSNRIEDSRNELPISSGVEIKEDDMAGILQVLDGFRSNSK